MSLRLSRAWAEATTTSTLLAHYANKTIEMCENVCGNDAQLSFCSCSSPLELRIRCFQLATPAPTPGPPTSYVPTPFPTPNTRFIPDLPPGVLSSGDTGVHPIAWIVIALVVYCVLLGLIFWWVWRRQNKNQN